MSLELSKGTEFTTSQYALALGVHRETARAKLGVLKSRGVVENTVLAVVVRGDGKKQSRVKGWRWLGFEGVAKEVPKEGELVSGKREGEVADKSREEIVVDGNRPSI